MNEETPHKFRLHLTYREYLVLLCIILFFSIGTASLLTASKNRSGASDLAEAPKPICSLQGAMSLPFSSTNTGQLALSATALPSASGVVYSGTGTLSDATHTFTLDRLTELTCSLQSEGKDGSNTHTVVHVEGIGTLATPSSTETLIPIIVNLVPTQNGSLALDTFTVLSVSGDWYSESLTPTVSTMRVTPSPK